MKINIIYPEGDYRYFKGTNRKPFFFMCKVCGQIEYFSDSYSWNKSCCNCECFGNNFLPITLTTMFNWFIHTKLWFKEELIAQLLESSFSDHKKIGEALYKSVFEDNLVNLK